MELKTARMEIRLAPSSKELLVAIARICSLSAAAVIRKLLHTEAERLGLLAAAPDQERSSDNA